VTWFSAPTRRLPRGMGDRVRALRPG
jgi:hypothetical protein